MCTSPPPSSSALTTSPVAAFTSGGPPRKIVPWFLTMIGLVAHRRHVGAARRARAHHHRDLRDALRAHVGLVEEDAAEVLAVGEDLVLARQEGAAGVDQVDARQAVLLRDLLRAQVLLHRHRVVGAALHRRVVGDDHAFAARDAADAGDHAGGRAPRRRTCRRRRAGRSRGTASPDRAGASTRSRGSSLPRADVPLARLGVAAERDLGGLGAQVVDQLRRAAALARNSSERVSMREGIAGMGLRPSLLLWSGA